MSQQQDIQLVWRQVQHNTFHADICFAPSDSSHVENRKYVVLLHGWMGHRGDLHSLASPFVKRGYSVVAPDLPYHGDSGGEEVLSCSDAARLLSDTIPNLFQCHEQRPLHVILVGYSLGGRIALEIAILAQEGRIDYSIHVETLVLISSAVPPQDESERSSCRRVSISRYEKLLDKKFSVEKYEDWLRNSWYATELWGNIREKPFFSELVSQRVHAFSKRKRTGWALASKNMCRSTMTSISEPLQCPVLYFYGTHDRKYAAMSIRLQKICLNIRCRPIEGAGHNIHLDSLSSLLSHIEASLEDRSHMVVDSIPKVSEVKFVTYSIPLKQKIIVGGQEVKEREGIAVALLATNRCIGVGDICPLPGLHHETVGHCVKEVKDLASALQALNRPLNVMSIQDLLMFLDLVQCYSRVSRNGFEAAFVHLLSQVLHQPISASIRMCASHFLQAEDFTTSEFVDLNGVLPRMSKNTDPSEERPLGSQYHESVRMSPFKVMKLKVGACGTIEEEVKAVRKAASLANSSRKRIRLDANRAWTISEYEQFETGLKEFVEWIEYIEEPFSTPEQLFQFLAAQPEKSCRIPLALDESLNQCPYGRIRDMASSELCRAFVLKPAVIGSLRHLLQLLSIAKRHDCEVVFSTVFESGIGTAWTAALASVLGSTDQHHGIGTFQHLVHDVIEPSFEEAVVKGGGRIWMESCEHFLCQAASSVLDNEVVQV